MKDEAVKAENVAGEQGTVDVLRHEDKDFGTDQAGNFIRCYQFIAKANLQRNDCCGGMFDSEVGGHHIGSYPSKEIAEVIMIP